MCDTPPPEMEVEEGSAMGGGECSESPAHIIEPQVEFDEGQEDHYLEPNVELNEHVEPHVELQEDAEHYGYGSSLAVEYYEGAEGYHQNGLSQESEEADMSMDTSNSEALGSSYKEEEETNYNEMQRTYLKDFFSSSASDHVEEPSSSIDPNIERIALNRFPSIVKVVERAEYETIQILYQLLYQRSAWDTQELLSKRILEFSGFPFGKSSEEYYNREMLLQTLPNSTLVKIGAILCLDHVKNVLSNVGLGRHDLINAILEFLALPKKKTRGPRQRKNDFGTLPKASAQRKNDIGTLPKASPQSSNRAVSTESVQPCGCRNNCLAKFNASEREVLNQYYLTLKPKRKQDAYFFNIIKVDKSVKRPDDYSKKHRDYRYSYNIKVGRKEVGVCKGGFMMLHGVKISRLNELQAKIKRGYYISKTDRSEAWCPAPEGAEEEPEPPKEEPPKEGPPMEEVPKSGEPSEESNTCSVENSVTNSSVNSPESVSSKAEDASVNSEDVTPVENEVKDTIAKKGPAIVMEKTDASKIRSQTEDSNKTDSDSASKDDDGAKKKLKDFPLVVKSIEEVSEELLIDLHFLLFLNSAESNKLKDNILEFDGFTFGSDTEEYDERNEFLQRMSGKLLTECARAFSLGVMSKREETIENIVSFLMKPGESYLRTSPSVPVILSDVELDDIEGMSDSDESITCEVVEKKVECIDLLTEADDLSSGGEDSDTEGKPKKSAVKAAKAAPPPTPTLMPAYVPAPVPAEPSSSTKESEPAPQPGSGANGARTLRDFETIRKIVNTHPPEYLIDIYELLYLKKHEPNTLRQEILDFTGFDFDKSAQDYVKRKQVLDRMLYNNVRRVYNTLIHNSTEVKVFSKPTMINEIFQFLFKLPDHDTSVRPLPPGAKTLMPKPATSASSKPKSTPVTTTTPSAAPTPASILSSQTGKLSDLKRVFQRVACFPCEYLVDVHKLLFMTDCDPQVIRQNIFGFKGFSFGVDSPEFQQRKMYLEYLTFHSLRKISSVLTTRSVDLRNSTKHELASHLTDVLAEYCNTLVETDSIVPNISAVTTNVTPTATPYVPTVVTTSSVENIVVTPSIEGIQSAAPSTSSSAKKTTTPTSSSMNISIVDTRSISSPSVAVSSPAPARGSRKRKSQTVRQMMVSEKKLNSGPSQSAENQFADIHLPEVEQYRQIYGANLNVSAGPYAENHFLNQMYQQMYELKTVSVQLERLNSDFINSYTSKMLNIEHNYQPTEYVNSNIKSNLENDKYKFQHDEYATFPHSSNFIYSQPMDVTENYAEGNASHTARTAQAYIQDMYSPRQALERMSYEDPNVPTITGIASFGTPVPQSFPQMVPQAMTFPFSPYPQALQVQNMQQPPQMLGLQSTTITMPTSIITQVSTKPAETIVPADIERKTPEESKTGEKTDIPKTGELNMTPKIKKVFNLTKTNSEKQCLYRERRRNNPEKEKETKKKDRERYHATKKLVDGLSGQALHARRENVRERVQRYRIKKKQSRSRGKMALSESVSRQSKLDNSQKDEEEDGDKPLASLIGHPIDSALEKSISDIVKKTNLQDITMNGVIQRIYDMYPKFDLSYRKDFIKSTLRSILYKLGEENQKSVKKESARDSSSPDCSVTTTDNRDSS